jgi:ABC-2 type transport system permease protein
MIRSFRVELSKIWHWPAFWALLALWASLAVIFGYVSQYLAYLTPAAGVTATQQQATLAAMLPSGVVGKEIPGYPLFGGVVALALGALTLGSEFGWGTWTTILVQDSARSRVVAGKLGALAVAVATQVLAGFGISAVASVMVAVAQRQPITGPAPSDLAVGLFVAWLILMAWAGIGAVLATVLRSTALPLGIGFAYLLIERLVAALAGRSDVVATIARLLPGTNAGSLASSILPPDFAVSAPGMNTLIAGPQAALVLAVYAVATGALTVAVIARRDVR